MVILKISVAQLIDGFKETLLSCNTMIKILKVHLLYQSIFQKKILYSFLHFYQREIFLGCVQHKVFWDEQVQHYLYLYVEWVPA